MKTLGRMLLPALSLVLVLGPLACGDDKNPTGPGTIGSSDQGTAQALVYGVVLPLIRDVFLEDYVNQIAPAPGNTPNACEPLTVCTSGSAQYCSDPGVLSVSFSQCDLGNTTLDGSVSLNVDQSSGTGTFSLTIDGDWDMTGTVGYAVEGECFNQSFTDVVITTDDFTIEMAGFATWCTPRAMVGGMVVPSYAGFLFTIESLGRVIDVVIFSDQPGSMEILVQNLSRTQNILACHGNITGGSLSCFDPNQ